MRFGVKVCSAGVVFLLTLQVWATNLAYELVYVPMFKPPDSSGMESQVLMMPKLHDMNYPRTEDILSLMNVPVRIPQMFSHGQTIDINLLSATSVTLSAESMQFGSRNYDSGVSVTLDLRNIDIEDLGYGGVNEEVVVESAVHGIRLTLGRLDDDDASWTLNILSRPEDVTRWEMYDKMTYPWLSDRVDEVQPDDSWKSVDDFRNVLLSCNPSESRGYLRDLFTPEGPRPDLAFKAAAERVPIMVNHLQHFSLARNDALVIATARCNNMLTVHSVGFRLVCNPYDDQWQIRETRRFTVSGRNARITWQRGTTQNPEKFIFDVLLREQNGIGEDDSSETQTLQFARLPGE